MRLLTVAAPSRRREVGRVAFVDEEVRLAEIEDPEASYRTTLVHEGVRLDLDYLERRSVPSDLRQPIRQTGAILVHH
jgi:hypothetical protein